MQLYALDGTKLIFASKAHKASHYRCPECLNSVYLKGNTHSLLYFSHSKANLLCQQYQKSLTHLHLQLHLKSLIPNSFTEKTLGSLRKIADVIWEEKKLIFEILTQPSSLEIVSKRHTTWIELGYTPIWLLDDRTFNRKHLTATEFFLRMQTCYYFYQTHIYDQFEVIDSNRRIYRGPKLMVDLTIPLFKTPLKQGPLCLTQKESCYHFKGDFCDCLSKKHLIYHFMHVELLKKRVQPFRVKKLCKALFRHMLQRFCM